MIESMDYSEKTNFSSKQDLIREYMNLKGVTSSEIAGALSLPHEIISSYLDKTFDPSTYPKESLPYINDKRFHDFPITEFNSLPVRRPAISDILKSLSILDCENYHTGQKLAFLMFEYGYTVPEMVGLLRGMALEYFTRVLETGVLKDTYYSDLQKAFNIQPDIIFGHKEVSSQGIDIDKLRSLETIGKKVKYLREVKGFNRRELSDETGIGYQTLSNIENDKVKNPHKLSALAKYFGLKIGDLNPSKKFSSAIEKMQNQSMGKTVSTVPWMNVFKNEDGKIIIEEKPIKFLFEEMPAGSVFMKFSSKNMGAKPFDKQYKKILFNRIKKPDLNDIILIQDNEGFGSLFQFVEMLDNHIEYTNIGEDKIFQIDRSKVKYIYLLDAEDFINNNK